MCAYVYMCTYLYTFQEIGATIRYWQESRLKLHRKNSANSTKRSLKILSFLCIGWSIRYGFRYDSYQKCEDNNTNIVCISLKFNNVLFIWWYRQSLKYLVLKISLLLKPYTLLLQKAHSHFASLTAINRLRKKKFYLFALKIIISHLSTCRLIVAPILMHDNLIFTEADITIRALLSYEKNKNQEKILVHSHLSRMNVRQHHNTEILVF